LVSPYMKMRHYIQYYYGRHAPAVFTGIWIFILCLSMLFTSGCAPKRKFISPQVELLGLNVRDVSFSHINYEANIRVYNPNLETLSITDVGYRLYLNDVNMVNGESQVDAVVEPHKEATIPLRLSGSLFSTLRFLASMPNARKISFVMKGTLHGHSQGGENFSLPFEEKGELDLQQLNPT